MSTWLDIGALANPIDNRVLSWKRRINVAADACYVVTSLSATGRLTAIFHVTSLRSGGIDVDSLSILDITPR